MKTRRDFLKRTALLGASAFIAPSLLGRESDGDCFFSQESTSSMLVPMGDALKITGTFLDEISHDIPHQNWGEREWDQDFRYMRSIGIDTVIMIRSGYRKFITYPSAHLLSKGCYMPSVDLLDMFLRLADKYSMKFYFGLYDSGRYWDTGDLSWEIEDNKYVIDEVWRRNLPAGVYHTGTDLRVYYDRCGVCPWTYDKKKSGGGISKLCKGKKGGLAQLWRLDQRDHPGTDRTVLFCHRWLGGQISV